MSDGPHRTLRMRPHWTQLAQRADNDAYDQSEICDSLRLALKADWDSDGPQDLWLPIQSALLGPQAYLFNDFQLECLRGRTIGRTFGEQFLDSTISAVRDGLSGDDAIHHGASGALYSHLDRHLRQIEEHYIRRHSPSRAARVRHRIKHAFDFCSNETKAIVTQLAERKIPHYQSRKTELDDGIRL